MRRHEFFWDGMGFPFHSDHEWYTKFPSGSQPPLGEIQFMQRFVSFTGCVVWDFGAHHGLYSRVFAILSGPTGGVVAIEADPRAHLALIRNCEENSRQPHEGLIVPLLVGIDTRTNYRYFTFDTANLASMVGNANQQIAIPCISTKCLSLFRPPDIIKIDIEGAEVFVIESIPLELCRAFTVEVHVQFLSPQQVMRIVNRCRELPHELFISSDWQMTPTPSWSGDLPTDGQPFTIAGVRGEYLAAQKRGA